MGFTLSHKTWEGWERNKVSPLFSLTELLLAIVFSRDIPPRSLRGGSLIADLSLGIKHDITFQ